LLLLARFDCGVAGPLGVGLPGYGTDRDVKAARAAAAGVRAVPGARPCLCPPAAG